jgi:hypothetical protein
LELGYDKPISDELESIISQYPIVHYIAHPTAISSTECEKMLQFFAKTEVANLTIHNLDGSIVYDTFEEIFVQNRTL